MRVFLFTSITRVPEKADFMVINTGIYLIASIMFADPWHMFHSFIPYLCLAPSFINILNVYAFCNLHDVSTRLFSLQIFGHYDLR